MVDPERIEQRLERLGELLGIIEEIRAEGRDRLLGDRRVQLEVEHALQVAVQICIDVGAHLIAELGLTMPDDYRGIFERLRDAGITDGDLAARLADATGLRNLLVHEYLEVDPAKLWQALDSMDDLRAFALAAERAASEG